MICMNKHPNPIIFLQNKKYKYLSFSLCFQGFSFTKPHENWKLYRVSLHSSGNMGNCQAAEAATVVIHHPGNTIERIHWSVSAHEIMNSNPGHYVALVVTSPTLMTENGMPLKQLKLLRPDDTLLIGRVYRLISFEDVLKEFAAKKCVKLGKLLERGGLGVEMQRKDSGRPNPTATQEKCNSVKVEQEFLRLGSNEGSTSSSSSSGSRIMGRHHGVVGGQWKPALQSISEIGT